MKIRIRSYSEVLKEMDQQDKEANRVIAVLQVALVVAAALLVKAWLKA